MSRHLILSVFDHEPASVRGTQLWKGGATDLTTRTMIGEPSRWLEIAEDVSAPTEGVALRRWNLEQINPGTLPSPETAGGVILVSMNVDPAQEDEFNDWYNTEHIPHLSGVPGVLAARRFRAVGGSQPGVPAYVALYHVESTGVYATRTWVVANETPWMLRMRRFQRNRTYFMFPTRVG
jgi:hypothetical protein